MTALSVLGGIHEMKKLHIILSSVFVAASLSSCVQTSVTRLDNSSTPLVATKPEQVCIYLSEDRAPKPYKEIAIINAMGAHNLPMDTFYKQVRKDAAKLGANGILVRKVQEPSAGAQVAAAVFGVGANTKAEYIAIKTL